jgi:hypothetical protein
MPEPLAVTDELADPLDGLPREQAPGTSVLDGVLETLRQGIEKRPAAAPGAPGAPVAPALGEPRLASELEPVAGAEDELDDAPEDELTDDGAPRALDEQPIGIDDPPPGRPISMWIDEDALRTLAGDGGGEACEGAPSGREISLWIDEGVLRAPGDAHDEGERELVGDESPEQEPDEEDAK